MLRLIGSRLLLLVPVLFLVTVGTFLLVELVPGDPAIQVLGPNSTQEDYERVREEMGLNESLPRRYVDWLSDAVLSGDLGNNLVPPIEPVSERLARAFPINLEIAFLALAMSFAVAIPLGVLSAFRQGSRFDRVTTTTMFGLISVPNFLAGILLILILAINWHVFPIGQWARPSDEGWVANLQHAFLPALTLALGEIAVFTRLLRSDMIATLQEDYILSARAKGMSTQHILFRQALRPSSFSLITLSGVNLGRLIGGTLVVETIFNLPGVGRLIIDSIFQEDYPMVQGAVLFVAAAYVIINLAVDLSYAYIDPRIRRGRI